MLVVTPGAHEDATTTERIALEIRNRASRSGICACGARGEFVGVDELGFGHLIWRHKPGCPAVSPEADRAVGL